MANLDLIAFKAKLHQRQQELADESKMGQSDRRAVELDQSSVGRLSRMDAMQRQAMAQATERRREQERQRIHTALERIEAGNFGYCLQCDEPVEAKRLELDPSVSICMACARERG